MIGANRNALRRGDIVGCAARFIGNFLAANYGTVRAVAVCNHRIDRQVAVCPAHGIPFGHIIVAGFQNKPRLIAKARRINAGFRSGCARRRVVNGQSVYVGGYAGNAALRAVESIGYAVCRELYRRLRRPNGIECQVAFRHRLRRSGRITRVRRGRAGECAPAEEVETVPHKMIRFYGKVFANGLIRAVAAGGIVGSAAAIIGQRIDRQPRVDDNRVVGLNAGERIDVAGVLSCGNIVFVVGYAGNFVSGRQRPVNACVGVVNIGARAGFCGNASRRIYRNGDGERLILPLRIEHAGRAGAARAHQNATPGRIGSSVAVRLRIPAGKHLSGVEERVILNDMRRVVRHARGNGFSAAGQRSAVSIVSNVNEHRRRAPLRSQGRIRGHRDGAVRVIEFVVHAGAPAVEAHAILRSNVSRIICLHLSLRVNAIVVVVYRLGAGCRTQIIG